MSTCLARMAGKKASLQITYSGDKDTDTAAHCKSKNRIIKRMCQSFIKRYTPQLDDAIVQAFIIFDPGLFPTDKDKLAAWGNTEIQFLMTHYHMHFKDGKSIENCMEQWQRLKTKIASNPSLRDLKFVDLWPKILVHFHDTYEVVLRLVVLNLLFIMDNSTAERDFSALNDLKDETQARMSHELTAAQMWWYKMRCSMSRARWNEAVERIGRQWMKADDTKSGTRRAHNAAPPLDEIAAVLQGAAEAAAAAATPTVPTNTDRIESA